MAGDEKAPIVGELILSHVAFLAPAAVIVRHHHEAFDGSGYPDGLAGEDIPLGARVFAFADTMDAMTSDRPYRKAAGFEAVIKRSVAAPAHNSTPISPIPSSPYH